MRISQIFQKQPLPVFSRSGKTFDQLFASPQRKKKAWEGQDKDAFFRDKYAHVHAKQLKRRKEEQQARLEKKPVKKQETGVKPIPEPDFASRVQSRLQSEPNLEFVYGTNAVIAVLQSRPVTALYTHGHFSELDKRVTALLKPSVTVEHLVPAQHLQILSNSGVHNKLVAETVKKEVLVGNYINVDEQLTLSLKPPTTNFEPSTTNIPIKITSRAFKYPLGLYIDQVTDTHNMGALMRSALWFGCDFVAFSARNSAPLSPAVLKASSGAAEFLQIVEVPYPLRMFDHLKSTNWNIVASGPNPQTLAKHRISLTDTPPSLLKDLTGPTLLVVGSEGDGIRTNLLQRSTHSTTIPSTQPNVNSLNVSVAAAVLLDRINS